jgi:hypothetical protein
MKQLIFLTCFLISYNVLANNSFEQKIEILEKELEQTKDDIKNLGEQKNINFKKMDEIEDEIKYSAILYEKHKKLREEKEVNDRRAKAELEMKLANTIARHENKENRDLAQEKEKIRISRMKIENNSLDKNESLAQEKEKTRISRLKIENESLNKSVKRQDEYIDRDLKRSDAVTNVVNSEGEAIRNVSQGQKSMLEGIGKEAEGKGKAYENLNKKN